MPVPADGLALMAALLLGWDRSRRLGAQRRRWMQSAGTAKCSGGRTPWRRRTASHSGPAHNGLAGANRAAIDGLPGHGRGTAGGQTWPRGLLHLTGRWTRLLEPGHHVGTRRNHWTRGWLSGQMLTRGVLSGQMLSSGIRARLRPQRGSRRWHRRWRRGFRGRRSSRRRGGWSSAGHWRRGNRNRSRR